MATDPRSHARFRGAVIAWMPVSQRSTTLATRLGYDLLLLGSGGFRRPWTAAVRYPRFALRTVAFLLSSRPLAVIVVAPPFVAALIVLPLTRLMGARIAVDVHSGALLDRRWKWSVRLLRGICKWTDTAVVTLVSLAERLGPGVVVTVLPDPLPPVVGVRWRPPVPGSVVVAICGWGDDEPIEAIVASAQDRPWHLVVTGRQRRTLATPDNVTLTGFIDDREYAGLLRGADVILVLTTRDETLLSGAWEAVAIGTPLVLSNTNALRATFGEGAIYTDAKPMDISTAIDASLAELDQGRRRMAILRDRLLIHNDSMLEVLRLRIETDGR